MTRTIELLDFFRHYRDLPHQRAAVQQLQESMPVTLLSNDAAWVETFRAAPPEKPGITEAAGPYWMIEPLLALIRQGESGNDYSAANQGTAGGKRWQGLTSMSIAEVMDAQAKAKLFAAGAYQITPEPMKQLLGRAGLPASAPFSKEAQDWLAVVLVLGGWKRPKLTSYLLGRCTSIDEAQTDLAYEWACMQGPSGRGMYDGDSAGNQARIPSKAIRAALALCRERIGGKSVQELGLKPPTIKPAPAPPPAPPARQIDPGMPKGSEEAGMTGPKIKAPMKPGDYYLLVNDKDEDMEAYDHTGKLLWKAPALARGQGDNWRARNADTPPGLYRLGKLYADYEQDPRARKTEERQSYGWFSFDMEEMENQERDHGRAGIMLHGGGGGHWPSAWAPRQSLHPTNGCIRMHNIDLRDKVLPLYRAGGTVFVGVYQ